MTKAIEILAICDQQIKKNSTSDTFYVYQAHFCADKQLVSHTQNDIFDF